MKHRIGLIPINVSEDITDNYKDNDYKFELNVIKGKEQNTNCQEEDKEHIQIQKQ